MERLQLSQTPVRGFLVSVGVTPEIRCDFQYNPTEVSDRRSATWASVNAPGLLMPVRQYVQGGDRTLSFTVRINGLADGPGAIEQDPDGSILPELNKYRAFVYPGTYRQGKSWRDAGASFVSLYTDQQRFAAPPDCLFGLGGRVISCAVIEVNVNEVAFNADLAPLRADVAVTLVELAPYAEPRVARGTGGA
jgi:Contractile injection system tube protein